MIDPFVLLFVLLIFLF